MAKPSLFCRVLWRTSLASGVGKWWKERLKRRKMRACGWVEEAWEGAVMLSAEGGGWVASTLSSI